MIRKYQTEDTDDLVAIWQMSSALAHPFLTEPFQAQEAENLRHLYLPNAETWVSLDAEKPTGFIAVVGSDIGGLFVAPHRQNQGWGKALVDFAIDLKGPLNVEVFEKNSIGRRFYARYGFIEAGRQRHEGSGEMTLLLRLPMA